MADMDPVARARAIAARLAATAIPSDALGKRKSRWEDDGGAFGAGEELRKHSESESALVRTKASGGDGDGKANVCTVVIIDVAVDGGAARPAPGAFGEKKRKKVYIPVDKYPDINFMGLLIGPRGSNQKRMEDESGAKILIRGKGSSKDPTGDPDENEELHVLITADTDEAIAKAQSAVEDILFNPQQAMKLKQEQLRKVAELNGTLNENYGNRDAEPAGHYGPGGGAGGGSGGEKDASTEMQVPRDLVGYIIGRGGETIRDLQMKSGAHIQIVREEEGAQGTPHRFVSISGTEESLQKAQTMIQNLIDERTNGGGGGPRGSGGFRERDDNDRMARYGGVNPDGSESMELLIPNERVGLIIGRGGTTIKSIQQRTGSSVTIPQTPDPNNPSMRLITIRGTIDAKEAAKQEIMSILNDDHGGRGGGGGGGGNTIYMQVPNDRVGVVIGKRGETIRGIQDRHGVRIQIPQVSDPGSNPPVRTISIQGPVDSLQRAKEEVDMVILQGAGGQGGGYGGQSSYGGSSHYGSGGYDQQQQYGQQQQQYGYGQAQGQTQPQGQYDAYYQQQYYQQQAADPSAAATATAADPAAAATDPSAPAATTAAATADPNDPNAYWNGYYEYAAYYGVDAANAAWGVTGAAAQASAEAYQQYQAGGGGAAGTTEGAADPAAGVPDASQAQAPPGTA